MPQPYKGCSDPLNPGKVERVHVVVAERALGHLLPEGAEVHHVDEDKQNNANDNLVICQDRTYHCLLHNRLKALRACGHVGWRQCSVCKEWAPIETMRVYAGQPGGRRERTHHVTCWNAYRSRWRRAKASLASLVMVIVSVGQMWKISFEPHPDNVGVVIISECKGKEPFFAYDRMDLVDQAQSSVTMRRQPTPKDARCTVVASVMRSPDDDPQHEYIADSVIVIQQED